MRSRPMETGFVRHRLRALLVALGVSALAIALNEATAQDSRRLREDEKPRVLAADGNPTGCNFYLQNFNCAATGSDGQPTTCGTAGGTGGVCANVTNGCSNVCSMTSVASWSCATWNNMGNIKTCPTMTATPPSGLNCGKVTNGGSCTSIPNANMNIPGAGFFCGRNGPPANGAASCSQYTAGGDSQTCPVNP